MKHHLALVGALLMVVGLLAACQQSNFSQRIFFRNGNGDVIAVAQIARPLEMIPEGDSFAGKWMLESWKDEFPKQGCSAEDYLVTRKGDNLRVDFNPRWSDDNVVLIGKKVGATYQGKWYYQNYGLGGHGTFEAAPISNPQTPLLTQPEASPR